MIDSLKNILLSEINNQVEEYEQSKQRINEIEERLKKLALILNLSLFSSDEERKLFLEPPVKPNLNNKKFSFLEKHIFKRKEYLSVENDNKKLQEEYQRELEEYYFKRTEYEKEAKNLNDELNVLKELCKDKEKIKDRFKFIKNAKTIKDLNLTVEEVKTVLQEHGINFVLEESDKIITENDSDFNKPEDFILVHKTNYHPTDSLIRSNFCSDAKITNTIKFENDVFSYEILQPRNTIHFCINGEVSSHKDGTFDGCKYAILIPFDKVKRDNLKSFNPVDTYFIEKVSTQEGYVLCPENEVEKIQKLNPNTTVIGYKGESVDGYAEAFLSMLGYKTEIIDMWDWRSKTDYDKAEDFWCNSNNGLEYKVHSMSREDEEEKLLQRYYNIIDFIKYLKMCISKEENDKNVLIERLFKTKAEISTKFAKNAKINAYFIQTDYAPSICKLLSLSYNASGKVLLKDCIDENFIDEETDPEKSNMNFLLFKLKKDYNIDISNETVELLLDNGKYKPVELFCEKIKDDNTKQLILQLLKEKIIEYTSDVKNVLFLSSIIDQIYLKKEIHQEKDSEDFKLNL